MADLPHSTCRSCKAPIEWAYTVKGGRIPLDPGVFDDGNISLDDAGVAHVVKTSGPLRRSHFASCPNAARHRRRRGA